MQLPPFTIHTFNTLDSTNRHLKKHIDQYDDYAVIWAMQQQAGRGRFERTWVSSPGDDLTFSIALPLSEIAPREWPNITQVMALSLFEALLEFSIRTTIKWPNDLLLDNKKLCGILCELTQRNNNTIAVLGVGLNVNAPMDHITTIDRPATSLFSQTSQKYELNTVIFHILERFYNNIKILQDNDFEQLRIKIWENLTFKAEHIIIVDGKTIHTGTIENLNPDGTLKFRCDECGIINLNSGEISFRTD